MRPLFQSGYHMRCEKRGTENIVVVSTKGFTRGFTYAPAVDAHMHWQLVNKCSSSGCTHARGLIEILELLECPTSHKKNLKKNPLSFSLITN